MSVTGTKPTQLAKITAPTLVLTGRHDKIAPPSASDEIVKGIPHAQQEMFEQSGHRLMREENAKSRTSLADAAEPRASTLSICYATTPCIGAR
jgi:pimeloyl-ACP methyl ester carboxylesterase